LEFGNFYMHMAIAISVTSDAQVFDESKRDRCDELRLQFEVVRQLPEGDRQVIKALIKGIVVKHETKRLVGRISGSGKNNTAQRLAGHSCRSSGAAHQDA